MTGEIVSVSRTDLVQRRKKLRQQRRLRLIRDSWRFLIASGLVGGIVWVVNSPIWVIRRAEQIEVKGNHYLKTATIRSLVPIAYPQSLWRVEPQSIADAIKGKMPVSEVTVSRELFPPGLRMQLKERDLVAVAVPSETVIETSKNSRENHQNSQPVAQPKGQLGLVDASGNWFALEKYTAIEPTFKLPALKVIGNPDQYRPYWQRLYRELNQTSIKITEIDWRDSNNLILKTELGNVQLGAYNPVHLNQQFAALSNMRSLPNQLSGNQINLIDISNPNAPTIQTSISKSPIKPKKP
jgi:cell division protein FtsQ